MLACAHTLPYPYADPNICTVTLQGFGKSLKTKAEDLIEGKITAPVIRALTMLNGQKEKQQWLWGQYQISREQRDIGGMVELIESSGAFQSCINEAHDMVHAAAWSLPLLSPACSTMLNGHHRSPDACLTFHGIFRLAGRQCVGSRRC